MPQIYPTATPGLPINIVTSFPLTGGGSAAPGSTVTLGLSSSDSSTRNAYSVTPSPDGTVQLFTIVDVPTNGDVTYADVFINGYIQPSSAYLISGSTLAINTAPSSGAKIYVVFSSPADNRQQFTLSASSSTVFTFPSILPLGTYVDIYDGNGVFQIPGSSYNLDISNGSYSVVFTSAPATPVLAVFDPSTNSGRQAYSLYPAANSSQTSFTIVNGNPSTAYIDVYQAGLFQMEGSSYALNFLNGVWTVVFSTPPTTGNSLEVVFSPSTVLPQNNGAVVNYLNNLSGIVTLTAGVNTSLSTVGQTIAISAAYPGVVGSVLSTTPTSSTYTYTSPTLPIGAYRMSAYLVVTAASGTSTISSTLSYTDTYGAQTNLIASLTSSVGAHTSASAIFYNAVASSTPTLVFSISGTGTASYIPQSITLERLG